MVKLFKAVCLAGLIGTFSHTIQAAGEIDKPISSEVKATLQAKLSGSRPGLTITSAVTTVIPGIIEVELSEGPTIYMTADGQYFLAGQLFKLTAGGLDNITEQKKDVIRAKEIATIDDSKAIIFPAEGQKKARITVFTDVDCGYCRKLHQEVPALNKMGIEVRYLAYPRAGIDSPSYRKISSAFCAVDKRAALTTLKSGQDIAENLCEKNPVKDQFELGRRMGVSGTPALIMDSGRMLPGYMPADRLAQALGVH